MCPPPPGGRLGADQHVSSLVGVKMLCVIHFCLHRACFNATSNQNGTDVVGVGTVVDCVVCVTNDIGTLVIIDDDGVCVASDIV